MTAGTWKGLLAEVLPEDHEVNLRQLWLDLAEGHIDEGVDWPSVVRTLFLDLDRLAARDNATAADAWDACVDHICSPNESGTANNLRFKRANPFRVHEAGPDSWPGFDR